MTDNNPPPDPTEIIPELKAHVDDVLEQRRRRRVAIAIVVAILLMLAAAFGGVWAGIHSQAEADSKAQQSKQAQTASAQVQSGLNDLAGRVKAACATPGKVRTQLQKLGACSVATEALSKSAKAQASAAISGPPGAAGAAGTPGRGIIGTQINNGDLSVAYSDGTVVNAGQVVGAPGARGLPGMTGPAGRGITGSSINDNGHLVLGYSDGTVIDMGPVVGSNGANGANGANGTNGANGANGVGVQSLTIDSNSHLIVTLTDGTTRDAGPVPAGPAGPPGPSGPAGAPGTNGTNGTDGKNAPTIVGLSCSGASGITITETLSDGSTYSATCTGPGPTSTAPAPSAPTPLSTTQIKVP